MRPGLWQILLVVVLIFILFGSSKIPDMMKNLAGGINAFKKELKDDAPAGDKKAPAKKAAAKKANSVKPAAKKSGVTKTAAKPAGKKSVQKTPRKK